MFIRDCLDLHYMKEEIYFWCILFLWQTGDSIYMCI